MSALDWLLFQKDRKDDFGDSASGLAFEIFKYEDFGASAAGKFLSDGVGLHLLN